LNKKNIRGDEMLLTELERILAQFFDGMNKVPSFLFANTPRDAFFCGFNARNHAPVYVYTLES